MNATMTRTDDRTLSRSTGLAASLFAIVMGVSIIFVAGHVQATTLHDAAHDVRHSTGFPCH